MFLEGESPTLKYKKEKGSEFYNRSIKSCLQCNSIETYLKHLEGKPVVSE